MAVQFTRRDPGRDSPADETFQPFLPQRILDRHGARVLNPSAAVVAAGWARPRPTVYRSASLLIPEDVLRDTETLNMINRILGEAGLQLVLPPPLSRLGEDLLPYLDYLDQLPRAVTLRVRPGAAPTEVDSWVALQRLRAAASGDQPMLPVAVVERISIEHLLTSTVTMSGTPGSWESSGSTAANGSYVRRSAGNRIAVALALPPPHRHPVSELTDRRPVIAVLDSGIAPHPWFGIADRTQPPPADGFLAVLPGLQQAILTQEEYQANWQPTQLLLDYWDAPVSSEPLVGDVDTDTGHGTFIAGIIRQVAPDATVLAVRVTHSDGVIYEGDVLLTLWRIAAQVRLAQHNDGSWVHHWATGAAVVSTYPIDVQGSARPDHDVPGRHRDSLDPDDFRAGFAVWDGTSFAAPLGAARLADALLRDVATDPSLGLAATDRQVMVERASAAWKTID
ncbi:MAG TPA: S8/S53 family peptidase [Pseudonocardiaceae bacterium]|nr:S8/S53 family peptidase [Pseudonocardiaceae bacterium]